MSTVKSKTLMKGFPEIKQLLKDAPRGTKQYALEGIATYLIGDGSHGLTKEPARVTHGAENPYDFQTDKSRRWWFANNDGPYQRTGNLAAGWVYDFQNSDYSSLKLENIEEYAGYVMGDQQQRGHIADKWRYYVDVISSNLTGALRKGQQMIDQWIKEHA